MGDNRMIKKLLWHIFCYFKCLQIATHLSKTFQLSIVETFSFEDLNQRLFVRPDHILVEESKEGLRARELAKLFELKLKGNEFYD